MNKRKDAAKKHVRKMLRRLVSSAPRNLRFKILGSVLGSGMIIILIQTCLRFHNDCEEIHTLTEHTLNGVVRTLATQLDAEAHKRLIEEFEKTQDISSLRGHKEYQEIQIALDKAREANNLDAEIFTIVHDPDKRHVYVAVSSSPNVRFRRKYNGTFEPQSQNLSIGIQSLETFGKIITSMAPMFDSEGNSIAHIVASSDSTAFQDIIYQKKIELILNIGMLILAIILILYKFVNPLLEEQEESQLKLMLKNQEWNESVRYARKIQESILPNETPFKSVFADVFILNKPKDIVSGDLIWNHNVGKKFFFALMDCTGHGVPGAFLTFLAYDALNRIVLDEQITQPSAVLEKLDHDLRNTLKRGEKISHLNGLDIAFCCFDFDTMEYTFSGARHHMLSVNDHVSLIKGTRRSIGESLGEQKTPFYETTHPFHSSDNFYFWTDGMQDQFGGPSDRKLSAKHFISILENVSHFPMDQQREIITIKFDEWKGANEQIDDVLVVGLRA